MGGICGSAGKRIRLQCGRLGFNPWVGKICWRRERLPIPVFWPGDFHGPYSPWDCLLDMFPLYNVLRSLIGIYLLFPEWGKPWKGLNKLALEFGVYFRMQWGEISKGKKWKSKASERGKVLAAFLPQ